MHNLVARLREHVIVNNPWEPAGDGDPFEGIHEIDSVRERERRLAEVNRMPGRLNRQSIDASDALFAILDGVDVDSGTAAEIGYAFGRGKYISGLRTDFRLAGDNPGSIVNLQVEYFILESGGRIVTDIEAFVDLAREFAAAHER